MCGTSLDGLDIAHCTFSRSGNKWSYSCNAFAEVDLPTQLRVKLKRATEFKQAELAELDLEVAEFFAISINEFLERPLPPPAYIASHGVTVFHQPENHYTLQIGSGELIAQRTGVTTICDFRSEDVAKGGQGAPLVPYPDSLLFSEYQATLNLGGFANMAIFKPDLIGFDICPCNKPINDLAQVILNAPLDKNGEGAKSGSLNSTLYHDLNALDFYAHRPPKSLGHEWYRDCFKPLMKSPTLDTLHTVTEHIAYQISNVLPKTGAVLCTGGGALNQFLIDRISHHTSCTIEVPNVELINFKEAIDFAFLGALRYANETNIKATVTGADSDSIAGTIHMAQFAQSI
ncbi:MAG: anhydro-N-acetylmuramic acid kinase [Salibacteraceae bacterium]